MRWFAAVVLALLLHSAPAAASCASAVYVDGILAVGYSDRGFDLPPDAGRVPIYSPACNDAGQDETGQSGSAQRLEGIPAKVAVHAGGTVFIAQDQMPMLAGHPVHIDTAPRRGCRPGPTVRRRAVTRFGTSTLGRGRDAVLLDNGTRVTNRPVTAPLRTGQLVRATTSRCGQLFADRVTFIGPTPAADRFVPPGNDVAGIPWWAVILLAVAALLGLPYLLLRVAYRPRA